MEKKNIKNSFVEGPISPDMISKSIANHQSKTAIGAHSIFLEPVRCQVPKDDGFTSVEFTANIDLANKIIHDTKEAAFVKYSLNCAHVYHSLGEVNAGEISLFVFTSAIDRQEATEALNFILQGVKEHAPITGRQSIKKH